MSYFGMLLFFTSYFQDLLHKTKFGMSNWRILGNRFYYKKIYISQLFYKSVAFFLYSHKI